MPRGLPDGYILGSSNEDQEKSLSVCLVWIRSAVSGDLLRPKTYVKMLTTSIRAAMSSIIKTANLHRLGHTVDITCKQHATESQTRETHSLPLISRRPCLSHYLECVRQVQKTSPPALPALLLLIREQSGHVYRLHGQFGSYYCPNIP